MQRAFWIQTHYTELKKLGHTINHKKVYRLMKELGLKCRKFMRKTRKYSSYKGKVGTVVKNKLNRRFSIPIILQKLVADVPEFECLGEEKLYLSTILDLCNDEVIAYDIDKTDLGLSHETFRRSRRHRQKF